MATADQQNKWSVITQSGALPRTGNHRLPSCAHAASPGVCTSPAARRRHTRRCTRPATAEAALPCHPQLPVAVTAHCCCLLQCPQLVRCSASMPPEGRVLLLLLVLPPAAAGCLQLVQPQPHQPAAVHWCCQRQCTAAAAQGQGSAVASPGARGVPAVLCCHPAAAPLLP